MTEWHLTASPTSSVGRWTAPENEVIWTKIDDSEGERNIAKLIRIGNLWFFPDRSMYVYYRPTHWHR
jgi:hypothetical protein